MSTRDKTTIICFSQCTQTVNMREGVYVHAKITLSVFEI